MSDGSPPPGGFFPLVYDELRRLAARRLANEAKDHTLNATALVHEAYLRLGDAAFADRNEFFRAAAVAMQRILVDHARSRKAAKRGGMARGVLLNEASLPLLATVDPDVVIDLDAALGRLAVEDPVSADVARHRIFAGLSLEGAAEVLGISRATAYREWAYARSWLAAALRSLEG